MSRPAPLALPEPAEILGQGDPAFAGLRRHHAASGAGLRVFVGAMLAVGAEIGRLRAIKKPAHGGARNFKRNHVALETAPPFRDVVQAQTGINHETCRRAEKLAADLAARLAGRRDADSRLARRLLADPDAAASYEHYATLARVAGACYDADTWSGILVEAGIVRPPISQVAERSGRGAPPGPGGQFSLHDQAAIAARGLLDRLREAAEHREQWLQRLAVLPLERTGDDTGPPSLAELRAEFHERLAEIDQIIARKQSQNDEHPKRRHRARERNIEPC